ncbi:MAG TPA: serine/threonine protein kinase [Thermoanaerobaculia bacterium]|nr:serine/threonine protein kinase [Thermoanaerobaculia bacterium]
MLRLSLLARISIALALVALVPLAYAVWSLFDVNRRGMHEQVLRTHAVAANTAAERIAGVVEVRRSLARSVAANEAAVNDAGFLQELLAADPSIEVLDVVNPAGESVLRVQRRGATERVGAVPRYSPAIWNGLLLVAEPLPDGRGEVRLIASATAVLDALDPAEIGDQAQIILASRDDRLVAGSTALASFPPPMITAARTARINGTGVYRDPRGREILGAFAPVAGTPWFVLSRQPSGLAEVISNSMRRRALTAAAVAICLALALILVAHRSVVRPIRDVIRAQRELGGFTALPAGNEIEQLQATAALIQRRIEDQEELGRIFLGRYQVLGVIGQGGMGTVFRGWDPKLRRHIALKTVHLGALAGDDAAHLIESLIAEAITAASVSHPNIVSVFDVEDATSVAFIAMELVEGVSLQSYLDQRARLPIEQTVLLGAAIARALEAAHARGILHHDIKPANVLLGFDGAIKVADFGLAALINSAAASKDNVFGTPGYIAPEAATGMGHDARTDLFALGVTLYEAIIGANPFQQDTARETMIASVTQHPPPLTERIVGDEVLTTLSAIVESLMAKKPDDRPQTAGEVALRLERLAQRHQLQWRLEPAQGVPLHTGHGSATLVPTIAIRATSLETQPR